MKNSAYIPGYPAVQGTNLTVMLRTCRAAVVSMFVLLCTCFLNGLFLLISSDSCPHLTKVRDQRHLLSLPFGVAGSIWGVLLWFLTLKAMWNFSWPSQNLDYKPPSFGRIELPQYKAASTAEGLKVCWLGWLPKCCSLCAEFHQSVG